MVDCLGPRVHEQFAKLHCNFSKYDLSREKTLKTEWAIKCLLFYSSTIIDNMSEESTQRNVGFHMLTDYI